MPLEPVTASIVAEVAKVGGLKFHQMPVNEGREFYRASVPELPEVKVHAVENFTIESSGRDIPVRLYLPEQQVEDSPASLPPLHLHLHGGGWVIGDLDTHDADCREICAGSGCIVLAVDYRLAPEAPFPAGLEDCYAVFLWASANLDKLGARSAPMSVGGDSAGGNLAAALSIMARDKKGPPIAFQLLLYPVTNAKMDSVSYQENAEGYLLTKELMGWFWSQYCPEAEQRDHPLASILLSPDLAHLPPALVMTAEYDPLRDEGEAYADRLTSAGVSVQLRRFEGLVHGFFSQAGYIDAARAGVDLATHALKEAHGLLESVKQ